MSGPAIGVDDVGKVLEAFRCQRVALENHCPIEPPTGECKTRPPSPSQQLIDPCRLPGEVVTLGEVRGGPSGVGVEPCRDNSSPAFSCRYAEAAVRRGRSGSTAARAARPPGLHRPRRSRRPG